MSKGHKFINPTQVGWTNFLPRIDFRLCSAQSYQVFKVYYR